MVDAERTTAARSARRTATRRRTPPPTVILLVRHGTTTTTGKALPGRAPGLHLADSGRAQADAVAARIAALAPGARGNGDSDVGGDAPEGRTAGGNDGELVGKPAGGGQAARPPRGARHRSRLQLATRARPRDRGAHRRGRGVRRAGRRRLARARRGLLDRPRAEGGHQAARV